MNFDKLLKILASMALAALVGVAARAWAGSPEAKPAAAKEEKKAAPAPRVVELKVTEKGFEPTPVTVKKGEPLVLRVTRTTDQTCAKDLIAPDYNVELTPTKAGKLKYGCSMGMMVAGVLIVE